ncbi:22408_t:CDS:2, partial [Racocetra persica]
MAAKISKPTSSKGDEFKELLVEARKQAKLYEGRPTSYSRRSWKSKRTEFWAPGPEKNHYAPYPPPQPYAQYPPAVQGLPAISVVALVTQHPYVPRKKREQTEGNNEQYGQKQGGGWENPRARGR